MCSEAYSSFSRETSEDAHTARSSSTTTSPRTDDTSELVKERLPDRLDVICLVWLVCVSGIYCLFPATELWYALPLFLLACLLPVLVNWMQKRQSHRRLYEPPKVLLYDDAGLWLDSHQIYGKKDISKLRLFLYRLAAMFRRARKLMEKTLSLSK